MLKFHRLTLLDFGPYRGEKTLTIPDHPGVMLILGDNGRGKTHLLNAFRYALLGTVYRRYGRARSELRSLANLETATAIGFAEFSVTLGFSKDGDRYEVIRHFTDRDGSNRETLILSKNDEPMNRQAADLELRRIMPEAIHQFFLFDSEVLQRYEQLVDEDQSTGEDLKEAIERILGVPILQNARTDVELVAKELARQIQIAAERHGETARQGQALGDLNASIEANESSARTLEEDIERWETEVQDVEREMTRHEQLSGLITRRNLLQEQLTGLEAQQIEAADQLKEVGRDAWRGALQPMVGPVLAELDTQLGRLRSRATELAYSRAVLTRLRDNAELCPTCGHSLTAADQKDLMRRLQSETAADEERNAERLIGLLEIERERIRATAAEQAVITAVIAADRERRRLVLAISDNRVQLEEISDQIRLAGGDGVDLKALTGRHSNLTRLLDRKRRDLGAVRTDLEEQRGRRAQISAKLTRVGGVVDPHITEKNDLVSQLKELFGEAVDLYRQRLRANVEREATRLFLLMRHEQSYTGLRINARYGLDIIYEDGSVVTNRATGEEQIVALALMGALQHSAPVQGPIVIDMPLGRLDQDHKYRVIAALPEMSEQVILLAFEGEFELNRARRDLMGRLVGERQLVRVSGRNTDIREVVS